MIAAIETKEISKIIKEYFGDTEKAQSCFCEIMMNILDIRDNDSPILVNTELLDMKKLGFQKLDFIAQEMGKVAVKRATELMELSEHFTV